MLVVHHAYLYVENKCYFFGVMKVAVQYVCLILFRNKMTRQTVITSTLSVLSRRVGLASTSSGHRFCSLKHPLCLKHALVVSKLTRYELECQRYPDVDKSTREELVRRNTYEYDMLLQRHNLHKEFERTVVKALNECGIEARTVNRAEYTQDNINWADIIIPTGGDGTFLLAASRIWGNQKPVMGFNSDPSKSEGFLCLPVKYSTNVTEAIKKLQKGEYEWLFRSRIRITLEGEQIDTKPMDLTETKINPTGSDIERMEHIVPELEASVSKSKESAVLSVLALNEVFMGESLSSRVSYFGLRIDEGEWTKVKSSGICVSTGSGSTSWHLSINRITEQSVSEVMKLLGTACRNPEHSKQITDEFNRNLVFRCDDHRMSYSVRELISAGVWPDPKGLKPRGYANRIEVLSRFFDGGLVVDGGIFYNFNGGTKAILQVHESDALRSIKFND